MKFGKWTILAFIAGLTGLLGACGTPTDALVDCPAIRIPQDTERVTRFSAEGKRDITDVVLRAEVRFLTGTCSVDKEEIDVTFPIAVLGQRGPADEDGREETKVFIAVTDSDRTVLQRTEIPLTLIFQGNRTSIVATESVTIEIPKTIKQDSSDFLVFIGLALSRDELAYNRLEIRR